MVDSPVGSTQPAGDRQSFGGAPYGRRQERHGEPPQAAAPAGAGGGDGADVRRGRAVALELLRERVLARTRALLGLDDGVHVPAFAGGGAADDVAAFAGRLVSEQNQLLALRVA